MAPVLAAFAMLVSAQKADVVVFPFGEKTGEKDPVFAEKMLTESRNYLITKLEKAGLAVMDSSKSDSALKANGFDPTDRDEWTTPNLLHLTRKLGARQSIFIAITESSNGENNAAFSFGGGATGTAKLKIWYLAANSDKPILKGFAIEGKSSTNVGGNFSGSKGRILRAIRIAIDKGLDESLRTNKTSH